MVFVDGGENMRDTAHHVSSDFSAEASHAGRDGFVILAVVCAAIVVAMFSLHGAPDLLGGQFDPASISAR